MKITKRKLLLLLMLLLMLLIALLSLLFLVERSKDRLRTEFKEISHSLKLTLNYYSLSLDSTEIQTLDMDNLALEVLQLELSLKDNSCLESLRIITNSTEKLRLQAIMPQATECLELNTMDSKYWLVASIPVYDSTLIDNGAINSSIKLTQKNCILILPYMQWQLLIKSELHTLTVIIAILLVALLIISLTIIKIKLKRKGANSTDNNFTKVEINNLAIGNKNLSELAVKYNQLLDYYETNCQGIAFYEREAAWRELAKQVAHEIRNPLTPMRLKVQMLQRYKSDNLQDYVHRVDETLDLLLEEIELLAKISSDFSEMSQIPVMNLEDVDLVGLMHSVMEIFEVKSDLQVTLECSYSQLIVNANYAAMLRVMINLIKNAYEASNGTNCLVQIKALKLDSEVRIELQNNGPKIDQEILERIFELNFTTKEGGSGLGLAICRGVVESFDGRIEVRNLEPQGVLFTIALPLIINE